MFSRSVHYWAGIATRSRLYRYARRVPTTLSGCLTCMASARTPALGPFLFTIDLMTGYAVRIVRHPH